MYSATDGPRGTNYSATDGLGGGTTLGGRGGLF